MRSSISYILRPVALLLALVTTSCVNDDQTACPPFGQAEQYVLNLRITTQKAATRTTRAEGDDIEEATDAEDRINIEGNDFAVLVFDGYGRLIQRFEPSSAIISRQESGYEVTGVLGETSADRIQVAVIANCKSMAAAAVYDRFVLGHTFLSDMYSDGTTWNFTLPNDGWQPDGAGKAIPMYGCSGVALLSAAKQNAIDKERYDLDLGEIRMLRAVAKIEVADALPDGVELAPDITLSNYNAVGRLIPDATANPDWNKEDTQVGAPTLPDAPATADGLKFFAETKTVGDETRTVYSAYVTEADLTANRAVINLTVRDSGANPTSKDYKMEVDEYADGKPTKRLGALLRNHIYRYEIRSASNTLNINYTICPMGTSVADIPDFE